MAHDLTKTSSYATAVAVGVAVVGSIVSGCGVSGGSGGGEPAASEQAVVVGFLLGGGDLASFDRDLTSRLTQVVAQCMRTSGFAYDGAGESVSAPGLGADEAYKTGYGLAVSTRYFDATFVGSGLLGTDDGTGWTVVDSAAEGDPYFDALSPAEQDAYLEALEGDAGCESQALDEAGLGFMGARSDDPTGLDEIVGLAGRYRAEPVVMAEDARISQCLREKGLGIDSAAAARGEIETQITKFVDQISGMVDGDHLNQAGQAALREIQANELTVADALYDCEALPFQVPEELIALATDQAQDYLGS